MSRPTTDYFLINPDLEHTLALKQALARLPRPGPPSALTVKVLVIVGRCLHARDGSHRPASMATLYFDQVSRDDGKLEWHLTNAVA